MQKKIVASSKGALRNKIKIALFNWLMDDGQFEIDGEEASHLISRILGLEDMGYTYHDVFDHAYEYGLTIPESVDELADGWAEEEDE